MSERMSELLWKAGGYTKLDGSYSLHESHLQKFAELIVRECAEICMKEFDTGLLMAPQAPGIAKQIKQHFGVEE
jgi:hypothetical protein